MKSSAFYPLWPMTIAGFSIFTGGNLFIAGMVLANLCSLAGWLLFYHVTANRFGPAVGQSALILLLTFPGSLFYQFIYSEPMFFLLLMLLWYGLEERRYWVVAFAAFLLPLTRAIGLFVTIPIAWHWLMQRPW